MASKHLKKKDSDPRQAEKVPKNGGSAAPDETGQAAAAPQGRHAVTADLPPEEYAALPPEKKAGRHAAAEPDDRSGKDKKKKTGKKKKEKKAAEKGGQTDPAADEQTVQALMQAMGGAGQSGPAAVTAPKPAAPAKHAPADEKAADTKKSKKKDKVTFRRVRAKKTPEEKQPMLSHRDAVGAAISMVAAVVLLAAALVIWFFRDSFSPDDLILSADNVAEAREEYLFDAGSGEAFAAAGRGLAVANAAGLELLDGSGTPVTSMVMQMESPTADGCGDFALFYDLGGKRMAVARFDGTVQELDVEGNILSATVSEGGYIAVTTEATGFRALVTVYDPQLEEIYRWFSSSAWVISANVSPDGRKLAVLSYTATGSEVRFFDLNDDEQKAAFPVSGTILLDMHWFTSNQLCALSSDQALFFDADGQWQNTYSFSGQYLIGYTFDGGNCAALALSPYRAGTTAKLVSLDSSGNELGNADIQSELVCLTANDLEIMALCSDGAVLYNSSLSEKGRLTGLTGFKYGLLRARGEALLIASNYAEVYTF